MPNFQKRLSLQHYFENSNSINMKKIIITLSIIALAISNMIAGPVDQQTAQRIGEKFV